jgi:hypothetical protein
VTVSVLVLGGAAAGSASLDVTVLPKPSFPAPATDVRSGPRHFTLVSSRYRSPASTTLVLRRSPAWAPRTFRGTDLQLAIEQHGIRKAPDLVFLVYGRDGSSGRYLVCANAHTHELRYAYDFAQLMRPPSGSEVEQVTWARELEGVLYVETTHLTYATATRGRNAYLNAIDLATHELRWRSPALVANASTFVVVGDLIVSGYGFTAEPDYLYLVDRGDGRVLDRLKMPSAPEVIRLHGNRLVVRTYDHDVVAQIVEP